MFEVKFMVEDAKLGEAFKRLAGVARDVEHRYVANVEPHTNGSTKLSAADATDAIVKYLRKHHAHEFQGPYMRKVLTDLGMPASSYSHRLASMVEQGLLKKGKTEGVTSTYHLVK